MTTITEEYSKTLASPISPEERQSERRMLSSLYRYETDTEVRHHLSSLSKPRAWRPNMMFMHFDLREECFINPLEVDPAFDTAPTSCRLDTELVTLHVDDLIHRMKLSAKQPLEHRLFTEAPITIGARRDWAAWIVTSAIDVFGQKDRKGRDQRLQEFVAESIPTRALPEDEAVQIEDGKVNLSQGLWGHRKKNMFERFFGPVSKVFTSPLVSAAGIPVLLQEAFGFFSKLIQDYTADADLQNLWQTKRLNFSIAGDAREDFQMRDGYWAIIDTDYVQRHPNLEDHKVDLEHQSFEILDANGKPINAPYLVTRFHLKPTET